MAQPVPSRAPGATLFLTPAEIFAQYPKAQPQANTAPLVRRPTPQQGIAIEILGHAVDYLADTNFYERRAADPAIQEAIAILKRCNRDVFSAAPEAEPARWRAARWLRSHLQPGTRPRAVATSVPARLVLVKR